MVFCPPFILPRACNHGLSHLPRVFGIHSFFAMVWFGSVGAQCFCLILAMVGKCCAFLVPYDGLLCFACSLWWFVGAVPLLVLCGDSLLWFLEGFRSLSHLQVYLSLSFGSYFVSALFCGDLCV